MKASGPNHTEREGQVVWWGREWLWWENDLNKLVMCDVMTAKFPHHADISTDVSWDI